MSEFSLHRLRDLLLLCRVAPGGKTLTGSDEGLNKKGHQELSVYPGFSCIRIRLLEVAKADYRFQTLEDQLYLPAPSVHLQDSGRGETSVKGGEYKGVVRRLKGLGLDSLTLTAAVS